MIGQAEHIPVHLGAMPEAVAAVMRNDPAPNDVWVLNNPYTGGTHLPDMPRVANRARLRRAPPAGRITPTSAGSSPASLPAFSTDLSQKGSSSRRRGWTGGVELIARTSRNPDERRGDLRAQLAAHHLAEQRSLELDASRPREGRVGHGPA